MLIAGPLLWMIGSIHNACQIYERADSHVQILQQCVYIPFLVGSLLFLVSAVLNSLDLSGSSHSGLKLLVSTLKTNLPHKNGFLKTVSYGKYYIFRGKDGSGLGFPGQYVCLWED